MNSAIQSLQRQIGELSSIVNSLRNEGLEHLQGTDRTAVDDASTSQSPRRPQSLAMASDPGASATVESSSVVPSSGYAFNVLDSTLAHSAMNALPESTQPSAPASPPITEADAPEKYHELVAAADPLAVMTKKDLLRFLDLYEEDLGLQIPHLEVDKIKNCVSQHSSGPTTGHIALVNKGCGRCYLKPGSDSLMRAIVALMLQIEDYRNRPIAQKLMDNLESHETKRFAQDSKIEPDELSLIVLKALFHFLTDNERLAWRLMGFAARMCLEIGLHRRHPFIPFTSASEKRRAVKLFWCVYVLERRWSFGSGLPSAINDADVDQQLNENVGSNSKTRCNLRANIYRTLPASTYAP